MDKDSQNLLKKVIAHVSHQLKSELAEHFHYHDLHHTEVVVQKAIEIGQAENLSEEDLFYLQLAAWFHDVGHISTLNDHEEKSIEEARKFLRNEGLDIRSIDKVCNCIAATAMPQSPTDALGQILCDADLYNLASDNFMPRTEKLRKELNDVKSMGMKKKAWQKLNVEFLSKHKYFTKYAQDNFEQKKQANLETVKKSILTGDKKLKELNQTIGKLQAKLDKVKNTTPTRGIETMFRLTSKNHIDLSSMADSKANIMISINSIILSIVVSVLLRKLEEYPHFVGPTVILTVVCLATIVLAILATRPNISKGIFTKDDIMNKKTNLLFFGNFHGMSLEEYEWGMKELMKDSEYLYGSLIKDIYFLGAVLGKKYRLLRAAYTTFMFGFVLAVLAFVLAEVYLKSLYMY